MLASTSRSFLPISATLADKALPDSEPLSFRLRSTEAHIEREPVHQVGASRFRPLCVPSLGASGTSILVANQLMSQPSEYPKPPFPKQKQPMPGATGKMNPAPDHGETSYKGS